jgi:hypothetical protein
MGTFQIHRFGVAPLLMGSHTHLKNKIRFDPVSVKLIKSIVRIGCMGHLWMSLRRDTLPYAEKSVSCHSERSEESLLNRNKRLRGILRAKFALRMTAFCFFSKLRTHPHNPIRWGPRVAGAFALCDNDFPVEISLLRNFGADS